MNNTMNANKIAIIVIGLCVTAVGQTQQLPAGAVSGSGTANFVPLWTAPKALGNSVIFQSTIGDVGVGTTTPGSKLDVVGNINLSGSLSFQGSPVLRLPGGLANGNVAFGIGTLQSTTGNANTAIGNNALLSDSTGGANTATGAGALLQHFRERQHGHGGRRTGGQQRRAL